MDFTCVGLAFGLGLDGCRRSCWRAGIYILNTTGESPKMLGSKRVCSQLNRDSPQMLVSHHQGEEKKLRWTPHMKMMRDIMKGQGTALGQPLSGSWCHRKSANSKIVPICSRSRLLTERARLSESEVAQSKAASLQSVHSGEDCYISWA